MSKITTSPKSRKLGLSYSRLKLPVIFLSATIIIVGGLFFFAGSISTESLTTEQVLQKQEWSEDEIVNSAVQRLQSKGQRESPEIFRHLQAQIEKLPAERRSEVRDKIMRQAVEQGIRDYRLMPVEKRQAVAERLRKQAIERKRELDSGKKISLPGVAKTGVSGTDLEEQRKQAGAAVMRIMEELSADERRELAPLIKEWVQIAEKL